MSKSRDIGDSAATINFIDNLTSDAQTQLNTLTTNVATNATAISNINVTSGSQTKTYSAGETSTITLSGNVLSPIIGVTKEVAQSGVSNNDWDVNSSSENYTRYNTAAATTLDFVGYVLSGASYDSVNFSFTGQTSTPRGLVFSSDGTQMYVVAEPNAYQYTLTTAYDLTTASYASKSFAFNTQSTSVLAIAFNSDGTKMYGISYGDKTVYQYVLSTAYDISTASYDSKSFSVNGQETDPYNLTFNSNGTKMFVIGTSGDDVNEYALSSADDVSTASFTTNFSVATQETTPYGLAFSSDGTSMFITGAGDSVWKYTLTTGFDLTTASYASETLNVSSQETTPNSIAFNSDGTKMFVSGTSSDKVHQYSIVPKVALGSGSFASADVGKTIEANSGVFILTSTAGAISQTTAPTSYAQVASGSWQMYGVVFNTTDGDLELSGQVKLANLSSPSQVATLNLATGGANISAPTGIFINSAGTRLFVTDDGPNDVIQLNLSTAFDITTGSYASKYLGVGNRDSNPSGLWFSPTGHRMFIAGKNGNNLLQFSASSGNEFEINQYSFDGSFNISSQSTDAKGVVFNPAGTTMIIVDDTDNALYQYTLSTAFTVSSASYANKSFSVSSQISSAASMGISSDGKKIFVNDFSSETVFEYELTTGFDIATASYTGRSYAMSAQMSSSAHLFILPDDQSFISGENAASTVYEYSCASSNVPSGYHAAHTTTSTDSQYWTDINSMTADEAAGSGAIYYCVSTDDRTTWKVAKGTDGERSIVRNNSGTWQYNSNGTYGSTTWANATTNAELAAIQEAMTGASAGTPYDLANSTAVTMTSAPGVGGTQAFVLKSDGTRGYYVIATAVYQADLPSAFTGSGGSWGSTTNFSVASQETGARCVRFKSDGSKMFVIGHVTDAVYQYSLSTAWDVTSASYDSVSFSVSSQSTTPSSLSFSENGSYMYIHDNSTSVAYQYNLSSAWDLSSASYSNNSITLSSPSGLAAIDVVDSGTKMFASFTGQIVEYSLSSAYDISSASATSDTFSSLGFNSTSIQILDSGGFMALVNGNEGAIQDINTTTSYPNQMNKTQLDAIPDANHFTLANDLDLAIIFNLSSGSTVPSSDGVAINYDANVLNQGAILGTDYTYDAPSQNKVRITSTNAANLKIRIV
jgi:sugar lactone lactonase YvrE